VLGGWPQGRTLARWSDEIEPEFAAEVRGRWDPPALYAAVLASQRARRLTWQALRHGQPTPWDYQPPRPAGRGHLDLNELERARRFPRPD